MAKKDSKQFVWLADSCDWSGKLYLVKGSTYEASLVDAEVLSEWIRTGAAQVAKAEEK
jgi:hypothetical protein